MIIFIKDSDLLLRTISDRINNIKVIKDSDNRETKIDVENCIEIIKDDLNRYNINKKEFYKHYK